jgi:hypothetical protein
MFRARRSLGSNAGKLLYSTACKLKALRTHTLGTLTLTEVARAVCVRGSLADIEYVHRAAFSRALYIDPMEFSRKYITCLSPTTVGR